MTEDQMRELFREMRDEPVPADSQARVRVGVARRSAKSDRSPVLLTQPRQGRVARRVSGKLIRWGTIAAALAAACVFFVVLRFRPSLPVREATAPQATSGKSTSPQATSAQSTSPEATSAPQSTSPLVAQEVQAPSRPPAQARPVTRPGKAVRVNPAGNVVIRIETPDPDVVIMLVGE